MDLDYTEIDREQTLLGELSLHHYRAETGETGYEVRIDGEFLMASHGAHGEVAMAELAHQRLPPGRRPLRALVGGLGAGHTLRAVLDLEGVAEVVVAEIGARVVTWNRRYFATVNGDAVDDARVEVRVADVIEVLARTSAGFDLVLLDVDNGPGWLAAPSNAALYRPRGLEIALAALRPGGVLAIWSPWHNPKLVDALGAAGVAAEVIETGGVEGFRDRQSDVIYLAGRTAGPPT